MNTSLLNSEGVKGWVKLHRQFVDWEWYTDNPVKSLFIHLLLTANHEDRTWKGTPVYRGERICSQASLSAETGLSRQQIRTALDKIFATKEATKRVTNGITIISICKYDSYQDPDEYHQPTEQPTEQPTNNHSVRMEEVYNNTNTITARARDTENISDSQEFNPLNPPPVRIEFKTAPGIKNAILDWIRQNKKAWEYQKNGAYLGKTDELIFRDVLDEFSVWLAEGNTVHPKNIIPTYLKWIRRHVRRG